MTPFAEANDSISSATWSASSRVGTRTSASGVLPSAGDPLDERDAEASVLPEPVGAFARMSRPASASGQDESLDAERLGDAAGRERLLDGLAHAERAKRMSDIWMFDSLNSGFEITLLETAKGGTRS